MRREGGWYLCNHQPQLPTSALDEAGAHRPLAQGWRSSQRSRADRTVPTPLIRLSVHTALTVHTSDSVALEAAPRSELLSCC